MWRYHHEEEALSGPGAVLVRLAGACLAPCLLRPLPAARAAHAEFAPMNGEAERDYARGCDPVLDLEFDDDPLDDESLIVVQAHALRHAQYVTRHAPT